MHNVMTRNVIIKLDEKSDMAKTIERLMITIQNHIVQDLQGQKFGDYQFVWMINKVDIERELKDEKESKTHEAR